MTRVVTIDFETYFDSEYSLKKLTTEEYLRDPRFEVICAVARVRSAAAHYTQRIVGPHADVAAALIALQLDAPGTIVVAHNAKFDVGILTWRFGIRPAFIADTMAMFRRLHGLESLCSLAKVSEFLSLSEPKGNATQWAQGMRRGDFTPTQLTAYMDYCELDATLTEQVFAMLYRHTPPSELQLIDWTTRAFTEPMIQLDQPLLASALREYNAQQEMVLARVGVTLEDLRSDAKLAMALRTMGVDPPTKVSPKTGKKSWAFSLQDVEFLNLQDHPDDAVAMLVDARLKTKSSLLGSRLQRFYDISRRGPLPVPLSYYGATATGRWSGEESLNLQNLPRAKPGKPPTLRQSLRAPDGYKFCVADLSQIELRCNAWQSGQRDVLDRLRSGIDEYAVMASSVFGFEVDKSTHKPERFVGKTATLGCGYQCGSERFHNMLQVDSRKYGVPLVDDSPEFAARVVQIYRARNPNIVKFWWATNDALLDIAQGTTRQLGPYTIENHCVRLPNGHTVLKYPMLDRRPEQDEETGAWELQWSYFRFREKSKNRIKTKIYGGKLVENITQAVARLFMSDAIVRLLPYYRVLFTVHDELVLLVPQHEPEERVTDIVRWAMLTPPPWAPDIPLECEIDFGYTYADAK